MRMPTTPRMSLTIVQILLCLVVIAYVGALDVQKIDAVPPALQNYKPTSHGQFAPRGATAVDSIVVKHDKKGVSIEITDKQYCDACHTTIDTALVLLRRAVEYRDRAPEDRNLQLASIEHDGQGKLTWPSDKMVEEVCNRAMSRFKPYLMVGCHRLMELHRQQVMAPWLGKEAATAGALFDNQLLLEHKHRFCGDTARACLVKGLNSHYDPLPGNVPRVRDRCENCMLLAADLRVTLNRLLTTIDYQPSPRARAAGITNAMSPDVFAALQDHYCSSLSMRHYRTGYLEEACAELFDEDEAPRLAALLRNGTFLHSQFQDEDRWARTVCVLQSHMCTDRQMREVRSRWEAAAEADYAVLEIEHQLRRAGAKYEALRQRVRTEFLEGDVLELMRDWEEVHGVAEPDDTCPASYGGADGGRGCRGQGADAVKEEEVLVPVKPPEQRKKAFRQPVRAVPPSTQPLLGAASTATADNATATTASPASSAADAPPATSTTTHASASAIAEGQARASTAQTDKGAASKDPFSRASGTVTDDKTGERIKVANVLPPQLKVWMEDKIEEINKDEREDSHLLKLRADLVTLREHQDRFSKMRRVWSLPNEFMLSDRVRKLVQVDVENDLAKEDGSKLGAAVKDVLEKREKEGKVEVQSVVEEGTDEVVDLTDNASFFKANEEDVVENEIIRQNKPMNKDEL